MPTNPTASSNIFSDDDIPVVDSSVRKAVPKPIPKLNPAKLPVVRKPLVPEIAPSHPVPMVVAQPLPRALPRAAAATVLAGHPITFSSSDAKARCEVVGETFLRGIRTEEQTREKLLLPTEHGGAGLSPKDVNVCIMVLSASVHKNSKQEEEEMARSKAEYLNRSRAKLIAEQEAVLNPPQPKLIPVDRTPTTPVVPVAPVYPPELDERRRAPPLINAKAELVSDVQYAPKLVGPIQELSAMTLEDFRRLGRRPEEALQKIREKLAVLAAQSYEMKTKGVEAWQSGPVYGLYLEYLRAALSGSSPEMTTKTKNETKQPTLSQEEFKAIMNFSQEVKYG